MTRRLRCAVGVVVAAIAISACNPIVTDPESFGGELDVTSARYEGPSPAWIEVSVREAAEYSVFAFALVRNEDLHGPETRSCIAPGGATVTCDITASDVRMTNQRVVPGDNSQWVRLMQAWSEERVGIVLVCVDPDTQELGCPETLRTGIRAVGADGKLTGDVFPAENETTP